MHVKSSSCRLYQTHHNRQRVRIIIGECTRSFSSQGRGGLSVPAGRRKRGGGSVVSRGCHCCCLVPACDRCNRRAAPARLGRTRQDKRNHKRLLKGRSAEGEGKGRERREKRLRPEQHPDHLEAVTAHCQLSAGHNCGRG